MTVEFVVRLDIEITDEQKSDFEKAICKSVLAKLADMDLSKDVSVSRISGDIGSGGPIGCNRAIGTTCLTLGR